MLLTYCTRYFVHERCQKLYSFTEQSSEYRQTPIFTHIALYLQKSYRKQLINNYGMNQYPYQSGPISSLGTQEDRVISFLFIVAQDFSCSKD